VNILAIAAHVPAFDRSSGDLRFFQMLRLLGKRHQVRLATYKTEEQHAERGAAEVGRYRSALEQARVAVFEDGVVASLRSGHQDAVLFEFHRACAKWIDRARFEQPHARMIVDSVDCHFLRFGRRARLTGLEEHRRAAATEREMELSAYSRADIVVTVTDEDRRELAKLLPGKPLVMIPNIHAMPTLESSSDRVPGRIVFVGGFKHEPNVDAIHHFCADVFPHVYSEVPSARLMIAGSDPPPSVQALAGPRIQVLGHLHDLAPLLRSAAVSVAPLRFGAGLKGKVGEAMSFAVPVVTTSVGAEGFGIESGIHALVADDASDFASAVMRLLRDPELAAQLGNGGRDLIARRFSEAAAECVLVQAFRRAASVAPGRLPMGNRLRIASSVALERNLLWRLR
jgi:glycosyltransferase involved in cell wall biosynthesis